MNTLDAVIFPDITPDAEVIHPLVHAFTSVVYCRPVENDPAPESPISCSIHAPAPLEEDRNRFLQLISDLQNRRDDYAGQLNRLSLAGLPRGSRTGLETGHSILSGLLHSKGIEDQKRDSRSLILWQARLVLKLGEMFDLEQARLDLQLAGIREKQRHLLSELQGEEDILFPLTEKISQMHGPREGQLNLRLKAWSRLVFLGEAAPSWNHPVFVTHQRDSLEKMQDEYERLTSRPLAGSISLLLPKAGGDTPQTIAPEALRENGPELLEKIWKTIKKQTDGEAPPSSELLEESKQWDAMIKNYYPDTDKNGCRLTLYHFPGISAKQLFLNTFGSDDDLPPKDRTDLNSSVTIGYLEK